MAPGEGELAIWSGDEVLMGDEERSRWMVPSRRCLSCGEIFIWRKEWACCWHRRAFCGDSCETRAREKMPELARETGLEESSQVEM